MIKYTGINHVALVTSKMDETIRFWRDLLGMRLVAGRGKPGYRQYFFEISENSLLSFIEWSGAEPIQEKDAGQIVKGPIAFDHICFEVEDEEILWSLKDNLEAADIWVTEVLDNAFIHSFFTFDPNGISLEFCHKVEGIDLRKEPIMLDKLPSEITREGSEPQPDKWPKVKNPTQPGDRKIYPGSLIELLKDKN